ncbi:hypothetical protein HDU86_003676 [Geranomyces michiganensis]|nr:hypothetical protein HDU86_003676 [Geranomyces michiganensis]
MPSDKSGKTPSGGSQNPQGSSQGNPQSNYQFYKQWGSQHNFMASYGLKPTPEGYEEGNAIREAFQAADRQDKQGGATVEVPV